MKSILVDDFAGIGTEQILVLLKTDSISETLNKFQITDFGKINHVVRLYWFRAKIVGKHLVEKERFGKEHILSLRNYFVFLKV